MEIRDKESYYIMIKGSILQEDITFRGYCTHAFNTRAPKYIYKYSLKTHGMLKM